MYAPQGFSAKRAVRLGELVASAYDQFDCFEGGRPWQPPAGYDLVRELTYSSQALGSIDKKGVLDDYLRKLRSFGAKKPDAIPIGFVARKRNEVFLIFRGTQTVKEWINNFNTKFVDFFLDGFGSVHEGFQNSYLGLRGQVDGAMGSLPKVGRIHVAGHSLGAAFATFAACDLESAMKRKVASLHTYGSPRVGDDRFVRAFNAAFARKTYRIANSSDLVTEIPFPVPFAGVFGGYFSHVDTPVVVTVQKNDVETNHAMATYLEVLREHEAKAGFFGRIFGRFVAPAEKA